MSEQPIVEQRFAHEVVPEPIEATGTRLDWARYYLARAQGFQQSCAEAIRMDDRQTGIEAAAWASVQFCDTALTGFLLLHADGTDDGVRRALADMGEGDCAAEFVWQRLAELDVDPARISSYGLYRLVEVSGAAT